MHEIEPYYNWLKYYDASADDRSPFFGKQYNHDVYSETIYGYYIDPAWDSIGSETLYLKVLYVDYTDRYAIIELIGEWNDTLNNDIMTLKRNMIELMLREDINKFILLGENVMNFHGSDDAYYEEWNDEVEDGWIAAVNFPEHVRQEMRRYRLQQYLHLDDDLYVQQWRTLHPSAFFDAIDKRIQRRLN